MFDTDFYCPSTDLTSPNPVLTRHHILKKKIFFSLNYTNPVSYFLFRFSKLDSLLSAMKLYLFSFCLHLRCDLLHWVFLLRNFSWILIHYHSFIIYTGNNVLLFLIFPIMPFYPSRNPNKKTGSINIIWKIKKLNSLIWK